MTFLKAMISSASVLALAIGLTPRLKGDEWNEKTYITFSAPVEIPGKVLPAGTYVFKLADSLSDRNIVQIFDADQTRLYATIMTIPDYRLQPTGKTVITFEERPANSPEGIRAWFYPGDDYGQEFVYPKTRAAELARLNNRTVPCMSDNLAESGTQPTRAEAELQMKSMKQAQLKAIQPSGTEVGIDQAFPNPNAK